MGKYDLHVHTIYSGDSSCGIEEAVKAARKRGLNGIAITDHNSVQGLEEALQYSTSEFIVIPGIEVSSSDGHILGLGSFNKIPSGLPAPETVERIKDEGGIAVAAHPFGLSLKPFSVLKADFDAIEVFNPRRYLANHLAERYASNHNISKFAGSDAHFSREIGLAGVYMEGKTKAKELLNKIKHGEVSVFGRVLPFRDYLRRTLYKFSAYR